MSVERTAAVVLVAIGIASLLLLFAIGTSRVTSTEEATSSGIAMPPILTAKQPMQSAVVPAAVKKAKRSVVRSAASETTDNNARKMRGLASPLTAGAADAIISAPADCAGQLGQNFDPCPGFVSVVALQSPGGDASAGGDAGAGACGAAGAGAAGAAGGGGGGGAGAGGGGGAGGGAGCK